MKTILDNRVAELINMEGRRGEKLAFGRLELCTLITGIININILFYFFDNKTMKDLLFSILILQNKIEENFTLVLLY